MSGRGSLRPASEGPITDTREKIADSLDQRSVLLAMHDDPLECVQSTTLANLGRKEVKIRDDAFVHGKCFHLGRDDELVAFPCIDVADTFETC